VLSADAPAHGFEYEPVAHISKFSYYKV
jgi:hypothetical protein